MSEWWVVLSNGVWILGLAVVLAAFSRADWRATIQSERLRMVLRRPQFGIPFWVGTALTCVGLALCDHRWWVRALWGILAVGFACEIGRWHLTRRGGQR